MQEDNSTSAAVLDNRNGVFLLRWIAEMVLVKRQKHIRGLFVRAHEIERTRKKRLQGHVRERKGPPRKISKKFGPFLNLCVSSLRQDHANLLCIVPILRDNLAAVYKLVVIRLACRGGTKVIETLPVPIGRTWAGIMFPHGPTL